jgi:dihydroneopterin aldolase
MMKLNLNGLEVKCIIGELPEERVKLQRLIVDAELEISDKAADSDELSDTVDYAVLADEIRAALVAAKCKMIERAAKIAAEVCLKDDNVSSVVLTITKSGAIPGLASASAQIQL